MYIPLPQRNPLRPASSPGPLHLEHTPPPPVSEVTPSTPPSNAPAADDRDAIARGVKAILVIEDDMRFARILLDVIHEAGMKALVASEGQVGLALARKYELTGIALDLRSPTWTAGPCSTC